MKALLITLLIITGISVFLIFLGMYDSNDTYEKSKKLHSPEENDWE